MRLVAALARMTRDLDLAEDLAQDALVAALEQWPDQGVPANPGAWLMAVAKRRAIDQFRRNDTLRRRTAELAHGLEEAEVPDLDAAVDHIEDDVLRLAFLCCHPALPPESRAALTLRLVGGLTTQEIARAYLVKDATMGQRISRAKRLLADSGAKLEMPIGAERQQRLADVMAVVYLVFNEGYAATGGDGLDPPRPLPRGDAAGPDARPPGARRARGARAAGAARAPGLAAAGAARRRRHAGPARGPGPAPLGPAADPPRPAALDRAEALAGRGKPIGTYVLQAAIAACHARARRAEDTDWVEIAGLYDVLATPPPARSSR